MIEKCRSGEEIQRIIDPVIKEMGFNYFALGKVMNPYAAEFARNIYYSGPPEWRRKWVDDGLCVHDPLFLFSIQEDEPFYFRTAYEKQKMNKAARRTRELAARFEMIDGYIIKLNGWTMCLSAPAEINLSEEQRSQLHALAWPVLCQWKEVCGVRRNFVENAWTPREREVFWRTAANTETTTAQLADNLGVSSHTYTTLRKRAIQKTGGHGFAGAIMQALKNRWLP